METNLDQVTFNQWMDSFFQNKFNQLSYSNARFPKRMEKVSLSLATAPSQPVKIAVPFKSVLISRIYSTATPTTDKAGSIKILFDYDNTMNVANAVSLFVNDSFDMDSSASQAFLTWDAQTDTTIDIYFFVDIAFRAGTTKTQIVGTVNTQNTNATSFYNKPSIPDSTTAYYIAADNANVYTVPANKYAVVSTFIFNRTGGVGYARLNGTNFMGASISAAVDVYSAGPKITIKAGDVLSTNAMSGTCNIFFTVEQYSV